MKELNVSKFKYTKILENSIKIEKSKGSMTREERKIRERTSGSEKLTMLRVHKQIRSFMYTLSKGNTYDLLLLKQLKLEREYIRELEKMKLKIRIELVTGQPAAGSYTLGEAGKVLGITRERVRQIETAAEKVLRHPEVARRLKTYRES